MTLSPDLQVKVADLDPETRTVYKRFVEMSRFYQRAATRDEMTHVMSMTMEPDLVGAHYGILKAQGLTDLDFSPPPVQVQLGDEGLAEPRSNGHLKVGPALTTQDYMAQAASGYRRYRKARRQSVTAYLEGGVALVAARALAEHGEWLPLLEEFEIPERQARRMMQLARAFGTDADAVIGSGGIRATLEALGKSDTVSDLDPVADSPSLTQPDSTPMSTPEEMTEDLDQLEAENYGLRQEVTELKEKAPTRTQKMEAELDIVKTTLNEKMDEIEQLRRALREARAQMSEYPHEREKVASERETMINTLRGQVNEWQTRYNDERRRANFWERKARALGWQPGGKDTG